MPMFQMIIVLWLNLMNLLYVVTVKPHNSALANKMEVYNEFMLLMICDSLSTLLGYPYT